jgi:tetratricopeptide (TPR) repeat protein
MPTILDLAGLPVPETAQGVSLAPALRGEADLQDMDAYVETFHTLYSYNWHELQGIRTGLWKYVRAPEAELYDLGSDPAELTNLAEVSTEVMFKASRSEHDTEMLEKMRALGYVGGSSRHARDLPSAGGDSPDPKTKITGLNARQEAGGHLRIAAALMMKGDFEAALERVEDARRVAPDYAEVPATEGLILVRSGDLDKGMDLLKLAIERDPQAQMVHQTLNNLGLAYLERGQCDLAIETLKRSLRLKEDYHNAMYNLGLAYQGCGDSEEAVRAYETLLEANPNLDPTFLRSVRARVEKLTSNR